MKRKRYSEEQIISILKVVMTQTASESLWPIYLYHLDYSQDYAEPPIGKSCAHALEGHRNNCSPG